MYVTDTGYINTSYIPKFYDADYVIMESNHVKMLMESAGTTLPQVPLPWVTASQWSTPLPLALAVA